MSFPDDSATPPFSGSSTSDIFETPDIVLQSPTTTERIVDTQSGFLVVIKQADERKSLSVKRRLGTPPSSSVLLTPDESVKLSKILNGSAFIDEIPKGFSPHAEEFISQFEHRHNRTNIGALNLVLNKLRSAVTVNAITILLVGVLIGFAVESFSVGHKPAPTVTSLASANAVQIDDFARSFVFELLDFNPSSYKMSQIMAMASMTSDLMQSYWTDTHFPLSKRQVAALAQDNTVMITSVKQSNDGNAVNADVYAHLINHKSNKTSPIHIQLKIESDAHNQLHVAALKDLSNAH